MLLAIVGEAKAFAARGLSGICPGCRQPVIPKCGTLKVHHWAHEASGDCDPWSEPIGPWHLSWQNLLRRECVEVLRGSHRADVIGSRDIVVELQHSPVSEDDIRAREAFYGNMLWLFDATHRFAKVHSGNRVFFSLGRSKHIPLCTKPVYLDFGDELIEVDEFTDAIPECSGYGIARERRWFVDKFLRTSLRDAVQLEIIPSAAKTRSNPWEANCPYDPIAYPTKWLTPSGQEIIIPVGTMALRMSSPVECRNRPFTDVLIDRSPEIANGWTKESLHEMEGLLTGTPVIFEGLLRVLPALPKAMNVRMLPRTAWDLWPKAEEHMKRGRIPVLKETTKDRILSLSEQYGKLPDRRTQWTPRLVESTPNKDLFLTQIPPRKRK